MSSTQPATQDKSAAAREETRSDERYLRPAVDIIETEEGMIITADMPGLDKKNLDIDIDKGILTIQGHVKKSETPHDLYREFELVSYYRQFHLPEFIDPDKTKAEYVNGVLSLTLSKLAAAKPKKIEIKVK
jgi:HSP20 family molecular chaperone IbpA